MTFFGAFVSTSLALFFTVLLGILTWDFRTERVAVVTAGLGSVTFVAFLWLLSKLLVL